MNTFQDENFDPDRATSSGAAFGWNNSIAPGSALGTLRVGVICGPGVFEAWQVETLRRIAAVDGVAIGGVIRVCATAEVESVRGLRKTSRLWAYYRALSARVHQRWAQLPVESPKFLVGIPEITCSAEATGGGSLSFAESDLSAIRRLKLGAMLCFGVEPLPNEILNNVEHGVWSFNHLDLSLYPGCPVGFWEVYHNREHTEISLRRLADRRSDEVTLYRRSFRTNRYSCTLTAQRIIWRTVDWPAAVCRRLVFDLGLGEGGNAPVLGEGRSAPSSPQTCIHVVRTMKRIAAKQVRDVFLASPGSKDRWALGVVDQPVEDLINPLFQPKARWIEAPPGGFFADPFAAQIGGRTFVFCEHWNDERRKGHIAVIESSDLRAFEKPYPVIEASFHLSYPFLLQDSGVWFCVPEQHQQGDISLYRAIDFPGGWEQCEVLVAGFPGIDPTLIWVDGQWWMFASSAKNERGAPESSLYAFYSDSIYGPWAPHRSNPIIERRGRSRPAGRLFWSEGRLIRPVQESINTYGEAILFYEITALSSSEYSERLIGRWERSDEWRYPSGIHHIERLDNGAVLVDAKQYPEELPDPAAEALKKLQHLRKRIGRWAPSVATDASSSGKREW